MDKDAATLAQMHLNTGFDDLSAREKDVLRRIAGRAAISRDIAADVSGHQTVGERLADRVASFGGSWTFIMIFGGTIVLWVTLNGVALTQAPDPYPFIFLNLILSMLASVQAPIIMMSQNRQAAKDRLTMTHDYEVNLKAELEIMSLHEKIDDIRMRQLSDHFARLEARLEALAAAVQSRT